MKSTVVHIKNMVCQRCLKVVKETFQKLGIDYKHVTLGEVVLFKPLEKHEYSVVEKALQVEGFELLGNKNSRLVEKIKNTIISYVHHPESHTLWANYTFSHNLAQHLGQDYRSLSQLFSSVEGITIEKYLIYQKIERVKELLNYGELNLTQIAQVTGYSSVQYLSNQFKRVTGLSPIAFKKLKAPRAGIDAR